MRTMFHRKHSKATPTVATSDEVGSPLSPTTSTASTLSPTSPTALEAHKIHTVTSLEELDKILEDNHHRFVVVFCLTSHHKDQDADEEEWYLQYERLNNMHFVRVNVDESEELQEFLNPRVKPSWVTYHRGHQTGWASGGMKKFVQAHSERKHSTSI